MQNKGEIFIYESNNNDLETSKIQEFYDNCSVFITGGTGFVGRLVIEKLLRSCPGIKKIYILTRAKKGKDSTKRIAEQFEDIVYSRMKEACPHFMDKIVLINGEVDKLNLGLSCDDRTKIIDNVDIFIHGAATVRFNAPLKQAVEVNLRGTREVIKLVQECTRLKSFVHISTAYSHCYLATIKDEFYPVKYTPEAIIDLVETYDVDVVENLTKLLVDKYPNTYTYSKGLAEELIRKYSVDVPTSIIRPSIVTSTYKEPLKGWISNLYGPGGLTVGTMMGVLRSFNIPNKNVILDCIPVDIVVNTIITSAWHTHEMYGRKSVNTKTPIIYNITTVADMPIGKSFELGYAKMKQCPSAKAIGYSWTLMTESKILHFLICLVTHWLYAYVVDSLRWLSGKKPRLVDVYKRIDKELDLLCFFFTHQWEFENSNVRKMYESLNGIDRKEFSICTKDVVAEDYINVYIEGFRLYLLKDKMDTLPYAKKKQIYLGLIFYTYLLGVFLIFTYILWNVLGLSLYYFS